ncbi:Mpo1-like protein [Shewanella sp. H8]|uniref:Mpo1 family 2-hydroxy fatty acid dioxygenase n=1 Tax=Shewanella sp. H8 TaxID=3342676 RepID=UPI003315805D
MKSAVEQLSTYKSVHLNPKNINTHFIGVPMIIWSAFLMLGTLRFAWLDYQVSAAMILTVVVLGYYMALHLRLALGLVLFILPVLYTSELVVHTSHPFYIAISIFIIGWVIQFVGHQYEKAKPAFMDDLNQLLIGPFFLMAELYFIFGWEKELAAEITPIAREKRRALENKRRSL